MIKFVLVACLLKCYTIEHNLDAADCARKARLGRVTIMTPDGPQNGANYRYNCEAQSIFDFNRTK